MMQQMTAQTYRPRVLDVGSGAGTRSLTHPSFAGWDIVRLDIDQAVKPDLVGSAVDMRAIVGEACFDAVWSSHQIEHLDDHDVQPTLREFNRVLKDDGFALITCPDIGAIAALIVNGKLDQPVYDSPAGPITPLDMVYGHRASIARGRSYMAHRTGFTPARLGSMTIAAGFKEVWTATGNMYDVWAVGLMPMARREDVLSKVSASQSQYVPIL